MYEEYINQLHVEARLRNLADSSIKTYTDFILRFLEYTGKDPQDITAEDVRNFLLFRQETIAATTLNHYNSAIHFFFRRVLHKPWDDDVIPRMKEDYHLPTILSLEEINHLLNYVDDIKYKAIFSLLYGSGLRVSEAVYLNYCDISRTNMTVHVRKSKSCIDRYTILSQKSLDILTEYWFAYNKPMDALFIQKTNHTTVSPNLRFSSISGIPVRKPELQNTSHHILYVMLLQLICWKMVWNFGISRRSSDIAILNLQRYICI